MKYIAPADMTVTSTSGRSVEFKKGEPTYCPPQMHAELISRGVVPAEEIPRAEPKPGSEPSDPVAREAALFAAFETMILADKREDFTGTGMPHAKALATVLGWTSVDAKERDIAWTKFQTAKEV